ncbi:MAG: ABC transporter permease [Acidobacteriota bacterium]|nr:ABC transporter permease [Acidobacteriota bacterium]
MNTLINDFKFGLRQLAKNPGFTIIAIITLALGIGATTAIFSVVNGVLLSPLPFPNAGRLAILGETSPKFTGGMSVSYLNFQDWQRQQRSFTGLAFYREWNSFNLSGRGGAEVVSAPMVSAGFFKILGVSPLLGRGFTTADDHVGAARTAILTYPFWQRRFGGKPAVLGKTLTMDDKSYTVIGVLPKDFWFFGKHDVYVPAGVYNRLWAHNRNMRSGARVVGRLAPRVSLSQAQADMSNIAVHLAQAYPKANAGGGIKLTPMPEFVVKDVKATLYLLLGAVCLVLLIACVNVANLLLSRSAAREKEMAIRTALGAARRRMVRQLLTESVMLALFGGGLGVLFAAGGTRLLLNAVPDELPRAQNVGMDVRVLLFVVAVSVITGLIFGLAPAFRTSKTDLRSSLQESSRGSTGRRNRLQKGLVVAEVGLALVLLVGAGLTLQTIVRLNHVDTGFDKTGALIFDVSLPPARYQAAVSNRAFYSVLRTRLASLPGVKAVGAASDMPMQGDSELFFYVEGRPKPEPQDMPWAMFYLTGPGYLHAMGISLLRGRFFTDQDTLNSQPVVVVDDAFARNFFAHDEAIGQHIIIPFKGLETPREIVGIVHHIKHFGPAGNKNWKINDAFYMPVAQIPDQFYESVGTLNLTLIVRTSVNPGSMTTSIKRVVHDIDNEVAVNGVQTMSNLVRSSMAAQRFTALLLGIFAALALVLASIGVYGVISYSVSQRTHEIGIRMTLGAQRRDLLKWVIWQGMTLALLGVAGGIVVSLFAMRLLAGRLYGVGAADPPTIVAVSLILAGVAFVACFVPARRATQVDPMVALRYE